MTDINKLLEKSSYSSSDVYAEIYYKFPAFLNSNERYRNMKLSSKIVYMFLKNKNEISLKNNWYDENKKIFIIFTISSLIEESNLSKSTILSALDELEKNKLLLKRKNGFNKKEFKMYPNFYYLLKPILEKNDVYMKQKHEEVQNSHHWSNQHLLDERVRNSDYQSNQRFKDGSNFKRSDKSTLTADSKKSDDGFKNRLELDNTFKDSKDVKDSNELVNNSIQQDNSKLEKILIESMIDDNELLQKYGQNTINCLLLVANDNLEVFQNWLNKLEYAIKTAEKEKGYQLNLFEQNGFSEHIQNELAVKLRMCIRRAKTDHTIKNGANFTFITLKNLFLFLLEQQLKLTKMGETV